MTIDHLQEIIGAGWNFPLAVNGRGGITLSRGETDIEQAIRLILGTAKGERRMRPEFGCAIHDLVFSPNNETTWGLARYAVQDALEFWEPRIEVEDVEVVADPDQPNCMEITITYLIRATKDARTLVFPFYLILPEGY